MENTLKNFLYAGIGLATVTTDKVKKTVDELVNKGRLSDSEAKKVVDDIFSSFNGKKEEVEKKLKDVVGKVVEKFNYVGKDEYTTLQKRVRELEEELAKSKEVRKTTARVTV